MNVNPQATSLEAAAGDSSPTVQGHDDGRMPARSRHNARAIGVLFLSAFLAYGVGSSIVTSITASGEVNAGALFLIGAALILLNSAIVIAIGVLMFSVLRSHNRAVAAGYLGTRIFEGVGLAVGVVSLLVLSGPAAIVANFVAYNVAMAGLGIGSVFFCALLLSAGLIPRFLATWGFVGYACFAGGSLLELFGVAGAGMFGAIPGGLFELTFGVWLIARGIRSVPMAVRSSGPVVSRAAH
jgi:hypothetical protein